ncbi:MAG TPA: baseplate J/gp47 family protein, partial [Gaiellaceae bacterium]|nr:baseplate J/gp47 family protein [Gaiellaceae bacterium]
ILGLPPYPALAATASTTWTMIDAAGYTVLAGTVIGITPSASGISYGFQVVDDFTVAPGDTVAAGVQCTALEAGAAASGLSGAVQVIDSLVFVEGVTLDNPTSGGQDAETIDAYLARLSALLTLLSPRPILPQDFAILAQRQIEGVARAVAIDLYNPGPPIDTNCPRCVTVAVADSSGEPVSAAIKTQVDDLLQSEREINFLVFVVDPSYTTIDVTFAATSFVGFDPADVQARAEAAVANYLDPGQWGLPSFGDTSGRSWINATEVRYLEVAGVLDRVDGLDYVTALSIGVHGGALGQADVALAGVAPLTRPGTITGAITAES